MHFRERIIKDTMMYSVANYIAMVVGIFLSIVTKNILGALGAGYFAMIKVFISYGDLSDLGSRDAMLREVAQAVGSGKNEEARKVRDVVFCFTLISSAIVVLIFMGISLFYIKDPILRYGVMIAGPLVFVTQLYNFMITFMRILKRVFSLSLTIVVNILGVAFFSILGAYAGGVFGMVTGLIIAALFSAYFAYRASGTQLGIRWEPREILRLVRIGLPLVISGYAMSVFLSVDAIMIGKMIGYKQLGFYTIALMSVQQINSLGRFTQIILQPYVQEKYGKEKNLVSSKSLFVKSTSVLIYLLPVFIAMIYYGVPVVVNYFLPKFILGLSAMRILTAAYYFVAVNEMSASILFTINKQSRTIPIFIAMTAFAIGLNYLFIVMGQGIKGVAFATAISFFCYFVIFFCYAFKHLM
ncbi:MAG: oligosaccharide flippase family protein, partial [Candidatus Omnitrophota bacterium]